MSQPSESGFYALKHSETRAHILATSKQLALEKGLSALTMDEIAKGSGLSRQRLYFYFKSKEEIFYQLQVSAMQEFIAFLKATLAEESGGSATQRLTHLLTATFAYQKAHAGDFVFTSDFDTYFRNREVPKAWREDYVRTYNDISFQSAFSTLLEQGITQKEFRADLNKQAVAFFWVNSLQLLLERLSLFACNGESHGEDERALLIAEATHALLADLQ
jgi:AcrR family transcriptional regulator